MYIELSDFQKSFAICIEKNLKHLNKCKMFFKKHIAKILDYKQRDPSQTAH